MQNKDFQGSHINMIDVSENSTAIMMDDSPIGSSAQSPVSSPARSTTKLIKVKARKQEYLSDDEQAQGVEAKMKEGEVRMGKKQGQIHDPGLMKLKKIDERDDELQQVNCFFYQASSQQQNKKNSDENQRQNVKQQKQIVQTENNQQQQLEQGETVREKEYIADSFIDLIFSPIPQNSYLSCMIICKEEFLSLTRSYDFYLVKGKKKILTASRNKLQVTSSFDIMDWKGEQKIGLIKGNFTGTQYTVIYGKEKRQHCWVGYQTNILGLSHQRGLTIIRNANKKLQKVPNFSQIKTYYENGFQKKFQKYQNRRAEKKGEKFQLDFEKKVDFPSIRNFIIENKFSQKCILFGKKAENMYYLQICHPFSIIEAFGIVVSNLDRKMLVR